MSPPEPSPEDRADPSPELLVGAGELISNVELRDVRPVSIEAIIEPGVAPGSHVAYVEVGVELAYAADVGVFGSRFDFSFRFRGDEEEPLGVIRFGLVLDYEVNEVFEPDPDAAEFVTGTTGYFAAYPYARELLQSLAARLQFDPVVLGLITRGSLQPGTVSVVPRQESKADAVEGRP